MKHLIFGLITTIMLCFNANAQTPAVGVILTTSSEIKPQIIIEGKLHKKNPRRNGTTCECSACFGLCDFNIKIELAKQSFIPVGNFEMLFYITENINHAEDLMQIDEDVTTFYNKKNYTIKKGDYQYVREIKDIISDGKKITTYDYTKLNVNIK